MAARSAALGYWASRSLSSSSAWPCLNEPYAAERGSCQTRVRLASARTTIPAVISMIETILVSRCTAGILAAVTERVRHTSRLYGSGRPEGTRGAADRLLPGRPGRARARAAALLGRSRHERDAEV